MHFLAGDLPAASSLRGRGESKERLLRRLRGPRHLAFEFPLDVSHVFEFSKA
jgi:hypothetical protein